MRTPARDLNWGGSWAGRDRERPRKAAKKQKEFLGKDLVIFSFIPDDFS
jgi:hypothetical protein